MIEMNRDQDDEENRPIEPTGGPNLEASVAKALVDEGLQTTNHVLERPDGASKLPVDGIERPDRGNEAPLREPDAKLVKRGKPDFDEFLEELRRAITSKSSKDKLPPVMKILKAGYNAKPLSHDIDAIFSLLKDWPGSNRLAIQLSVQTRKKRQPELIRFLRNRLLSYSRDHVVYPVADERTTSYELRRETLLGWIERNGNPSAAHDKPTVALLDLEWTRWAIVCLMEEPLLVRTEWLYAILDAFGTTSKEGDAEVEGSGFLLEIGNLFGSEKLTIQKVVAGRKLASAARDSDRIARRELAGARSTIEDQDSRIVGLTEHNESLDGSLSAARERIAELEGSLTAKARDVEQEKEERAKDQRHWDAQSERSLVRLANEISDRLAHEIKEARLCLGDESPNIRMAMDRLKRMEKFLSNLRVE